MNKGLRILLAALLLMGILLLARDHPAWAGNSTAQNNQVALQGSDQLVTLNGGREPGSVKPPPIVVIIIPRTGGTSIGGVCIVYVDRLAEDINLRGELLGYDSLKERPKDNARYLAGVCHLTYSRGGLIIAVLKPADGNVRICFAALPKIDGKIRIFDERAWTILDTILDHATNCAPAQMTGKYVLTTTQP
jgi:hypothetical protein